MKVIARHLKKTETLSTCLKDGCQYDSEPILTIENNKLFLRNCITSNVRGFTILEAMVVVLIIIFLTAIAIPTMPGVIARYHLKEAARNLYSDLQLAKITSLKEGSQTTVVFDSSGYRIFIDLNSNFNMDGSDQLIKSMKWNMFQDVIYNGTTFQNNSIGFLPDCRTSNPSGGFGAGSVTLSMSSGKQIRVVTNITGSTRIQ